MPIYTYKCNNCDSLFEHFHLMSESLEDCLLCEGKSCVERVPSFLLDSIKKDEIKKVGAVVESHIKQVKEELQQEKKELRNKQL